MAIERDTSSGAAPDGGPALDVPPAGLPVGSVLPRVRRKHDRTKYPWRQQRRRRKLRQTTVASALALLFLFGTLYFLLSRPSAGEGESGVRLTADVSALSA